MLHKWQMQQMLEQKQYTRDNTPEAQPLIEI